MWPTPVLYRGHPHSVDVRGKHRLAPSNTAKGLSGKEVMHVHRTCGILVSFPFWMLAFTPRLMPVLWVLDIAKLLFQEVCRHHGLAATIVSDRDGRFIPRLWQQRISFCLLGTKKFAVAERCDKLSSTSS